MSMNTMDTMDTINTECFELVTNKWIIQEEIGEDKFSTSYVAATPESEQVVIKVEKDIGIKQKEYTLRGEYKKMMHIQRIAMLAFKIPLADTPFTKSLHYGKHNNCPFIVLKQIGTDLDTMLKRSELKRFKQKTVFQIAIQVINALEIIHRAGYLHMNVKPANMVVDNSTSPPRIILKDFTLAIPYNTHRNVTSSFNGTEYEHGDVRFASMKALSTFRCRPKNDLQSLGYSLLEMLNNSEFSNEENIDELLKLKSAHRRKNLCKGNRVIREYFKVVDRIGRNEMPNYDKLRNIFHGRLNKYIFRLNKFIFKRTDRFDFGCPTEDYCEDMKQVAESEDMIDVYIKTVLRIKLIY